MSVVRSESPFAGPGLLIDRDATPTKNTPVLDASAKLQDFSSSQLSDSDTALTPRAQSHRIDWPTTVQEDVSLRARAQSRHHPWQVRQPPLSFASTAAFPSTSIYTGPVLSSLQIAERTAYRAAHPEFCAYENPRPAPNPPKKGITIQQAPSIVTMESSKQKKDAQPVQSILPDIVEETQPVLPNMVQKTQPRINDIVGEPQPALHDVVEQWIRSVPMPAHSKSIGINKSTHRRSESNHSVYESIEQASCSSNHTKANMGRKTNNHRHSVEILVSADQSLFLSQQHSEQQEDQDDRSPLALLDEVDDDMITVTSFTSEKDRPPRHPPLQHPHPSVRPRPSPGAPDDTTILPRTTYVPPKSKNPRSKTAKNLAFERTVKGTGSASRGGGHLRQARSIRQSKGYENLRAAALPITPSRPKANDHRQAAGKRHSQPRMSSIDEVIDQDSHTSSGRAPMAHGAATTPAAAPNAV